MHLLMSHTLMNSIKLSSLRLHYKMFLNCLLRGTSPTSFSYKLSSGVNEQMSVPHGAQVVKITNTHTYELDEAELDKILLREDIQDLPVAVVSVAGVYRAGKSFLLNFFLRYLKSPSSAQADGSWIAVDSKPLEGFHWKVGSDRITTGILLWSEPIVTVLPDTNQKVAIILMDTQGTFDSSSTFRDCSTVFALSILLSSVQIYNLMGNINENDLQYLEFFTDYGRAVDSQNGKPFQTLEFLVRDWQYPWEHMYGETGGAELLADRLTIKPEQPKELREVRQHIKSLFDKVTCFLMPHPGFAILNPQFKGAIRDIHPDFIGHLKSLVTSLFSPEKLLLKKINGDVVNAREYATYFKAYMKIFNSDKVPPAGTIVQATAEAGLLSASNEARRVYETGMEKECGVNQPSVPLRLLQEIHNKHLANARASFTSKRKMGSKEDADRYLNKLIQDLQPRLTDYKAINLSKMQKAVEDARNAYDSSISKVHGSKPFCVHSADLEKIHKDAVEAAMKVFDAARARAPGNVDEERTAFIKSFEQKYQKLKIENDRNNVTASMEVRMAYEHTLTSACTVTPPLTSSEFKKAHEKAMQEALDNFKSKRNRPDSYTEDVFKYDLVQDIMNTYTTMKGFNKSSNKIQLSKAKDVYNDYIETAWRKGQCLHPEDLIADHKVAKCKALIAFKPNKFCFDGFNVDDEDEVLLAQMLEFRYAELERINDKENQMAVQKAFDIFKAALEEKAGFSWWWLLIIPLIRDALSLPKYIKEAKNTALMKFEGSRRPGGFHNHDRYKEKLNQMMDEAINGGN